MDWRGSEIAFLEGKNAAQRKIIENRQDLTVAR
jgi:hypothetical protein